MTERGDGLQIEASQLYHHGVIPRVLVLVPAPTAVDLAYVKLGVHRQDIVLTTLPQLGVPEGAWTREKSARWTARWRSSPGFEHVSHPQPAL